MSAQWQQLQGHPIKLLATQTLTVDLRAKNWQLPVTTALENVYTNFAIYAPNSPHEYHMYALKIKS